MNPPLPLSARRIERGCVVSGPYGLLAIVVGVRGKTASLCRILINPRHHHRADLAIGFSDCLTLGINTGNRVRCRVFRLPVSKLRKRNETISADLLARVTVAVEKEDAITRWERVEIRSGGISGIYG